MGPLHLICADNFWLFWVMGRCSPLTIACSACIGRPFEITDFRTNIMSRICELTGKGRMVGNNVSHANNKTKRVFLPNLQKVTLLSEKLERSFKFRVSTSGLRSVEHVGGLDAWLLKTSDDKLSANAVKVKKELRKKAAEAA
jgi:large subunit ribosomal protein L28